MRKLLLVLTFILLFALRANAAVTLVGSVCTKMDGTFSTTHTMSGCTINASANVCTVSVSAYGGVSVSSVTIGGAAASLIGSEVANTNGRVISAYQRASPATGSQNTVVTFTAGTAGALIIQQCWSGWQTTSGFQSFATGVMDDTSSPTDLPTVTCVTDGMVVDAIQFTPNQSITVGAGQTQDAFLDETLFGPSRGASSHEAGAASVTMNWTFGTTLDYATLGFCLVPSGGGPPPSGIRTGSGLLLGVGK